MSKTSVIYRDIAVGAQENAVTTAVGATAESDPSNLPSGVENGKIITLEHNRFVLDGSFKTTYEQSNIAFWSDALSDSNCAFSAPPIITISFSKQFSSMGLTLVFDAATGEHCTAVNVKWYQGESLKANEDYAPDSATFFCSKRVESYDKIELTLEKTNLPARRAKLDRIIFGVIRAFGMDELRDAAIVNQMDESAIELPVSTFQWTLDSKSEIDYLFQLKQPVEVVSDENTLGIFYIDGSDRKNARIYKIECKDALGVLDDVPFSGGAYLGGVSAKTLLSALASPFSVEYADDVADTTLTGVLTAGTARSAIQQVIFAWGVCIATDGSESLRVFPLPSTPKAIPKDKTFTGASVKTSAVVTRVEVIAHTYTADANGNVEIGGQRYNDAKTSYVVSNPNLISTDKKNEKTIEQATLVSPTIGQTTAQRVYDYYEKRDTISARIVYSGEKLGDCVSIYTPWGTLATGNLGKMEVALSNTVVYKAEARA